MLRLAKLSWSTNVTQLAVLEVLPLLDCVELTVSYGCHAVDLAAYRTIVVVSRHQQLLEAKNNTPTWHAGVQTVFFLLGPCLYRQYWHILCALYNCTGYGILPHNRILDRATHTHTCDNFYLRRKVAVVESTLPYNCTSTGTIVDP